MDYGENVFLLLSYHMNFLYYKISRLTKIITLLGILLLLMLPVSIYFGMKMADSQKLWEVKEKHELDRYSANKTGQYPYWLVVERENVLIWVETPWDIYLNVDVGDLVRLNPDCTEVIGVVK